MSRLGTIHSDKNFDDRRFTKISENLVTALWIYDIDNYCIVWANKAALELWQSDSLEELTARDFKPGTSKAVQETLRDYQLVFSAGKTIAKNWLYYPKGIRKEAFCQMSGFLLDGQRIAILCEAIPSYLINENFSSESVIILSTYSNEGEFISGNPPFIENLMQDSIKLEYLFADIIDYNRAIDSLKRLGRFEDDILIKTKQGNHWHRLTMSYSQQKKSEPLILVQQFDINERKLNEISLSKDVITDPLTGLLNRRGLTQKLEKIELKDDEYIIFYIDLDGFKMINDSLGHSVGDIVLKTLAERLLTSPFDRGIACRFGGDEFIWVINSDDVQNDQDSIANQLISTLNNPYFDEGSRPMLISASVGIAQYPQDGRDFSKLILRADAAMYLAKKQGKRRWVNYIKGMEDSLQRQSKVAQYLFNAIEKSELSLYYQPIFDMSVEKIVAFEALIRWNSVELGWVSAEETICVAEEVGVITEIENWVIGQALGDLLKLQRLISPDITMAVNISGIHFTDPNLDKMIHKQLSNYQIAPEFLTIELTESALLADIDQENNSVDRITQNGINMSIDDFGTGYSSLAYLHKIPAKVVKIDRSFTQRVEQDASMLIGIFQLIESQGFKTLVEGVETVEQSKLLMNLGICLQQGYALGLPQPLGFYIEKFK